MSTPQNPYDGNPYSPSASQPQDPNQQYGETPQYGNDMPAAASTTSSSANTEQTSQIGESPSYPTTSAYGAPQMQPTSTLPPYDGQGYAQTASPEQPTQTFSAYNQAASPYAPGGQLPPQMPPQVSPQGSMNSNYPSYYGSPAPYNNDKWNGLVIAGFICSFFFGIIGLALSIIGLIQINKNGGKSKGMAIAGIAISVVNMLFSVIGTFAIINDAANDIVDSLPSVSRSAPAPSAKPTTPDYDDYDFDSDSSDNDLSDIGAQFGKSLEKNLRSGMSLEEAFKDPAVQRAISQLESSVSEEGIQLKLTAEDNTLVYTLRMDVSEPENLHESVTAPDLGGAMDRMLGKSLQESVKTLNAQTGRTDLQARLIVIDGNNKTVLDKIYKG